MRKLFIALIMVVASSAASQGVWAETGFEDCHTVRATADARNQGVSIDRAERRLHHYIAHELRSLGGKTVGPTHTHCIRNACEASAIVCRH